MEIRAEICLWKRPITFLLPGRGAPKPCDEPGGSRSSSLPPSSCAWNGKAGALWGSQSQPSPWPGPGEGHSGTFPGYSDLSSSTTETFHHNSMANSTFQVGWSTTFYPGGWKPYSPEGGIATSSATSYISCVIQEIKGLGLFPLRFAKGHKKPSFCLEKLTMDAVGADKHFRKSVAYLY